MFPLRVSGKMPLEKIEALPAVIREEVSRGQDVRFDRASFQKFDSPAHVWEVVFHVLRADIGLHMDRQHEVNFALHKRFLKEGIEIA